MSYSGYLNTLLVILNCYRIMITIGSYVIVQKVESEMCKLAKVTKNCEVVVDNLKIKLNGAIGKPYGLFEVQNGNLLVTASATEMGVCKF